MMLAKPSSAQVIPAWKITDFLKYIDSSSEKILVVNFWASFCKPCVAEIPSFISISEEYKNRGVRLLLLSLDVPSAYPVKVKSFVRVNNFNTNIAWLNESDAEYFIPKIDSSWSGSIPSTLMISKETGKRLFVEDELKPETFREMIEQLLNDN